MAREYRKHNYVVRCGGNVKAYLTEIEYPKGHPPVYTYGTQDPKKAKKFTKEEAEEIAKARQATAVELKEWKNDNTHE